MFFRKGRSKSGTTRKRGLSSLGALQDIKPGELAEAALAMLLTVGVVGAVVVIMVCLAFGVPWLVGIACLVVAWCLFTLDFYAAELESRKRRRQ